MPSTSAARLRKGSGSPIAGNFVLQRKCSCGNHSASGGQCSECARKKRRNEGGLTIGARNDPLEREADRVAAHVLAAPVQPVLNGAAPRIQRHAAGGAGDHAEVPASVHRVLGGSGRPLDKNVRQDMQNRFGENFSHVRVHSDGAAAKSARDVNARAYTVGNNVVFGSGMYSPGTNVGRHLLAHELTHVVQQTGGRAARGRRTGGASSVLQRSPTGGSAGRENVWGLPVTRSMCRCRQRVRDGIDWANTAAATYRACDIPANATGTDVENCFEAAHPGSAPVASTDSSGNIDMPPRPTDPCDRIEHKATFVHETFHARHANDIARAQGAAFFAEWRRLRGDPNRLDTLEATFPAEVAAFDAQWDDGHDWAQDEVNSYTWERRFLQDTLRALNRIC